MALIAGAVSLLDSPERLAPTLAKLGHRHRGYGVQAAHCDVVGMALIDTLAAALGAAFTAGHRAAWAAVYGHMARVMQQGLAAAGDAARGRSAQPA